VSAVPERIAIFVADRAGQRCEYCRMHQSLQGATFHIEHILPRSKSGTNEADNLAFACPSCNLHKSDRIATFDIATQSTVPLFDPRADVWHEHFEWNGCELTGKTETGRATIALLLLNAPRRLQIREMEKSFGLFPNN
jgi:hypothetical protein